MAALTDDELKAELAAVLRKPNAAALTAGHFATLIAAANRNAQDDINAALANRGYTAALAATWDSYAKFNRDIGLYYCGQSLMSEFTTAEGALLKAFDRRKELADAPFTVAGVLTPADVVDEDVFDDGIGGGDVRTGCEFFAPPRRGW